MRKAWGAVGRLLAQHLSSQEPARRNALVACTALAERRRERLEVEEFLETYLADRAG